MALRKIIVEGHPTLRKKSRPVEKFDDRLATLIDDMKETLVDANGVGLAAPQVAILRRICIVDNGGELLELVNPEIIEQSGEQDGLEGCLSVPDKYGRAKRPNYVKIKAQDRHGVWHEYEGTELVARCFCHEIEHLDGHLYTEKAYHMLTDEEYEALFTDDEEDA